MKAMKKQIVILLAVLLLANSSLGQNTSQTGRKVLEERYFLSTSLWSLSNLGKEPADFYELNFGYRLTEKENLIFNTTTWKYWEPLGIPYWNDKKYNHTEDYPGIVRAYGVGIIYQRFLWKQFFGAAHVNTFLQNFYGEQGEKLQNGFQLYLQFRLGYRWEIFDHRFFLEPALSFNYWPINTNFPDNFQQIEDNWPDYFLFEPHLNFGINF